MWQCVLQFGNLSAQQERNQIARDLHDSLGHALTALNIQLQAATNLLQDDPAQARHFLAEAHRLGLVAIKETRQTVSTLRADVSETQSLEILIRSLVEDFYQTTGVMPSISLTPLDDLSSQVVQTLYRITQEALNNIRKYAAATIVQIQVSKMATSICFMIQDNGRGFKLDQATMGFGLQGIRERVQVLRGTFHLESDLGKGCQIVVELPLKPVWSGEERLANLNVANLNVQINEDLNSKTASLSSCLSEELVHSLATFLARKIGPIAPELIQWVALEASSLEDLIRDIALCLPLEEQSEFRCWASFWVRGIPDQPKVQSSDLPNTPKVNDQIVDNKFVQRCEQELVGRVGPAASLLLQETLRGCQQISRAALVKMLAIKIPDPQKAIDFKNCLLV
jgi:two-component sensor histidine kinase